VRLERAHAECLGQGEGLAVVRLSLFGLGGIMAGVERAVRADPSFMMQTDWIRQAERLMAR